MHLIDVFCIYSKNCESILELHCESALFRLSSGESGSGKTEAFKHIVRHLTARSSPKNFALEPRMKHVSLGSHWVVVSWRLISMFHVPCSTQTVLIKKLMNICV